MPSSCCEMRLRKDRVYYFPASLSTPRKWPAHPRYTCRYITLAKRQPLCAPRPRASGDRSAVGAGARGGGPAREPGGPALASPGPRARRGRRHPGDPGGALGTEVHTRSLFERPRERRDRVTASQRSRALHKAGVTAVKPAKAGVCGTWRSPLFVCAMFSSALSPASTEFPTTRVSIFSHLQHVSTSTCYK